MYFRAERIDPRALGEHLGDIAAATATISGAASAGSSNRRSDNTNAADTASAPPAAGDNELP
jgi:hypothetical protein